MLYDGGTAGERTVVSVLNVELSTAPASVDLRALGLNENCKGKLMPWSMEPQ